MTKRMITTIILLIAMCFILCGCIPRPYAEQLISKNENTSIGDVDKPSQDEPILSERTLYVSGAVQKDGFIVIPQICDYKTALGIAGVTSFSVMPSNPTSPISVDLDVLIVDFTIDGVVYSSVNVNGAAVALRLSIDGVDDEVVIKLADYIEVNGKITNRSILRLALSDDYDDNYYKFYIDLDDYA